MQDNGLLSFFNKRARQRGYINVSPFAGFVCKSTSGRVSKFYYPQTSQIYYQKKVSAVEKDAEILLSQIYAKAGIKSCTYLPSNGGKSVVCENIKDESTFSAEELLELGSDIGRAVAHEGFPSKIGDGEVKISKYFSKDAIRDYLKMQLFDTATFNVDRNLQNFMLKIGDDSKVEEVRSYDYGSSGHLLSWMWGYDTVDPKDGSFNNEQWYVNNLGFEGFKSRLEMIAQFRENESINKFLPVEDATQSLRSVDVQEVASEIKDATGYKVADEYVDAIELLIDDTASRLEQ